MAHIPFQIAFPVYTIARWAVHESAYDVLERFEFVPRLSRTCRSCGCLTQRRVFGILLCALCTRNPLKKNCWMIPAKWAGGIPIRVHSGPRGGLVMASDVLIVRNLTRAKLLRLMGLPPLRKIRATRR